MSAVRLAETSWGVWLGWQGGPRPITCLASLLSPGLRAKCVLWRNKTHGPRATQESSWGRDTCTYREPSLHCGTGAFFSAVMPSTVPKIPTWAHTAPIPSRGE